MKNGLSWAIKQGYTEGSLLPCASTVTCPTDVVISPKKVRRTQSSLREFTRRNRDLSDRSDCMHVHTSIMGMTGVPER